MASILKTDKIEGVTASGTVQMPAGHVVQSQFHQFNDETSASSTSFADITGSSFSFTPKFATSKLHIRFDAHVNFKRTATNAGGTVQIVVDGSAITGSPTAEYMFYALASNPVEIHCTQSFMSQMSATNTNAKTIKLQVRIYNSSSSGLVRINQGNYFYSGIKVQEIAQ